MGADTDSANRNTAPPCVFGRIEERACDGRTSQQRKAWTIRDILGSAAADDVTIEVNVPAMNIANPMRVLIERDFSEHEDRRVVKSVLPNFQDRASELGQDRGQQRNV